MVHGPLKVVVYSGTRNVYHAMVASVRSLLKHTDVDKVYLLIEDDVFPHPMDARVEAVNLSGQKWFPKDGPNYGCRWTYMVLMKVALHRIFPDLDRVLWLDDDVLVKEDISELWDIPLDGYYLAAAREPVKCDRYGYLYINAGVMMMNLKKIRDDGMGDEWIRCVNTTKYNAVEQDCISEHGGILEISSDYNANDFTLPSEHPKMIHFAGVKDWERLMWTTKV